MSEISFTGLTSVNGSFVITKADGSTEKVDLGTLMMMINLDRTQNLDDQITVQLQEIQDRNAEIKELTDLMSYCRKLKSGGQGMKNETLEEKDKVKLMKEMTNQGVTFDPKKDLTMENYLKYVSGMDEGEIANHKKMLEVVEKHGIDWASIAHDRPSGKDDKAEWDAAWDSNINNIKSKIDTLNNDSQIDNIKLQNLLEKRSNAFEMTTKIMDTNNQSIQGILRNL